MLGYILFGLFIILVMKTVRDVISFRYDISIFTRLPGWIQEFIKDTHHVVFHWQFLEGTGNLHNFLDNILPIIQIFLPLAIHITRVSGL